MQFRKAMKKYNIKARTVVKEIYVGSESIIDERAQTLLRDVLDAQAPVGPGGTLRQGPVK